MDNSSLSDNKPAFRNTLKIMFPPPLNIFVPLCVAEKPGFGAGINWSPRIDIIRKYKSMLFATRNF